MWNVPQTWSANTNAALGGHIKCGAKSRAYLPVLLLRKVDTKNVTLMLRKIKVILTCPLSYVWPLVVCPAPLINHWETEVKTKLKPGLLKVGQYYGINRNLHTHRKGTSRDRLVVVQYYRNHIFNLFMGTFKYKRRVFDEKLDAICLVILVI